MQIFPALGNYETFSKNLFPIESSQEEIAWYYNELEEQWLKFLPKETMATVKNGGFYSVSAESGFRVISLNTNYCNFRNWWLLINITDPFNQLQWLTNELFNAENSGEKVHIIGHITPGDQQCNKVWSKNYHRIINRYKKKIFDWFFHDF